MRGYGYFRGLKKKRQRLAGPTLVYTELDVSDWSAYQVTYGTGPANPEDGGNSVAVLETVDGGTHGITSLVSGIVANRAYRFRILVKGINENIIAVVASMNGDSRYMYVDLTTGADLLSFGLTNLQFQDIGDGWKVIMVDTLVTDITFPNMYFGISKAGPNPLFSGSVTDGLAIGSVRIYDIGALSGAIRVPAGASLQVNAPSSTFDDFSAGAWFRIDSYPNQYISLFTITKEVSPGNNQYFWFGHDHDAGGSPGARGLSVYGNNGSHSTTLLPAVGTWAHLAVTKTGSIVRAYINGVIVSWDTGGTTVDIGQSQYVNIEKILWCKELGGTDVLDGAIRSAFLKQGTVFNDTDILEIMTHSDPNEFTPMTASWPLIAPTDLTATVGPNLTAVGTQLGFTAQPEEITQ